MFISFNNKLDRKAKAIDYNPATIIPLYIGVVLNGAPFNYRIDTIMSRHSAVSMCVKKITVHSHSGLQNKFYKHCRILKFFFIILI